MRLRSGSLLQADLSLIVQSDPPARVSFRCELLLSGKGTSPPTGGGHARVETHHLVEAGPPGG